MAFPRSLRTKFNKKDILDKWDQFDGVLYFIIKTFIINFLHNKNCLKCIKIVVTNYVSVNRVGRKFFVVGPKYFEAKKHQNIKHVQPQLKFRRYNN